MTGFNRFIRSFHFLALGGLLIASTGFAQQLLRFPDIHADKVVFVSGEDIWIAPVQGGAATRLTIHDGDERFPKFSPDGRQIAFTGEYDGNTDVYVMDTYGGNITRLTYHPSIDQVIGWDEKTNKIMFASFRETARGSTKIYLMNPDGSEIEPMIMDEAAQGSFSEDGRRFAYARVSVEGRTWKRYRGGLAPDLYIYEFSTKSEKQITDWIGNDSNPMWIGNKIYFTSDRDRVLNIWAYDPATGKTEQVTRHTEYDVRRPSAGGNQIVYELGGDLYVLDVTSGQSKRMPVELRSDEPQRRPYLKDISENLTAADCSPDGKTALIVARGEVFMVPKEKGITRNLSRNCGARDKDAVWSPDGKTIAWFSDADGEYNLYLTDAIGKTAPVKVTDYKNGYRHSLQWSPDSRKIGFTDQTLTLYYYDLTSKKVVKVDKADYENVDISQDLKDIYDFSWSPDSRFIAYAKMDQSLVNKIYIYAVESAQTRCISDGLFNDFHPEFSKDGEHLFFVSNRQFEPTFCDFEWEMVYKKLAGIYSYTLRRDGKPLFPVLPEADNAKDSQDSKNKDAQKLVTIDFDGLNQRVETLPVERGNYRYLAATEKTLFYMNKDEGDFNRFEFRERGPMDLYAFSLEDQSAGKVIEGIDSYKLSADGSSIVYKKDKEAGILDASARDSKGSAISLADVKVWFDPVKEWRQIFDEAWRLERDFYYEPNMHGLDWPAMKVKYGKMLDRASGRQDVQYVIGELIGELNSSHTYVFGGDVQRKADNIRVGMLGADYGMDKDSKRYFLKKIYRDVDWNRNERPPLSGPGLDIKEGDFLLMVNGREIFTDKEIYGYFIDLAGKPVEITVNNKPTLQGARTYTVKPVGSENNLRYINWVESNRRWVDQASNGQIGYLHLPDTYTGSAQLFPRYFYSQTTKKGIIVDGRNNGGGLDPDIFLQRLNKHPLSFWTRRYSEDYFSPWLGTTAQLVCLTNRQAGSGGDELPHLFRQKGMGKVIGTRTWGGLIGVSMFINMIDGGGLSAPDYRVYDAEGNWVVENEGVTPDIIIEMDPADYGTGRDAQLRKGLEVLMDQIKANPVEWPKHEPFPVDK